MFSATILCTVVVFIELFLLFRFHHSRAGGRHRTGINLLAAWVGWALIVFVLCEILSALKLLAPTPLYVAWGIVISTLLLLIFAQVKNKPRSFTLDRIRQAVRAFAAIRPVDSIYSVALVLGFSVLMFVAFVYPPNNFDSMTYHLPRVMHWAQNQSLEPYATSIERQVQMQPLAETLLLNLYLLSKTDRLFNFVQLGSFLITLVGIGEIQALLLTSDKKTSRAAVLLGLSIPLGLLEAVTTQNDLVSAAFVICFVCFGLQLRRNGGWRWAFYSGAALGLVILTKASAAFFIFPLIVYLGIGFLRSYKWRGLLWGACIGILSLAIYTPYSLRIARVYGYFGGPTQAYRNAVLGLDVIYSNAIRNIALNFTPRSLEDQSDIREFAQDVLRELHRLVVLSPLDPRTTWTSSTLDPFMLVNANTEDRGANPVHIGLIGLSVIALAWRIARNRDPVSIYASLLIAGFLMFCAVFRWQPWNNRLLLPLFFLWCPAIASLLFRRIPTWIQIPILAVMLVLGFRGVWGSIFRPLDPPLYRQTTPMDLIFLTSFGIQPAYSDMMHTIKEINCETIGLVIDENTHEYQLWRIMKAEKINGTIRHLAVHNATAKYEPAAPPVCAVISEKSQGYQPDGSWTRFEHGGFELFIRD